MSKPMKEKPMKTLDDVYEQLKANVGLYEMLVRNLKPRPSATRNLIMDKINKTQFMIDLLEKHLL